MSKQEIKVVFFDINSKYEEDEEEIVSSEEKLESPIKIIKYFCKNKELTNFSENNSNSSEIKFEFTLTRNKSLINCNCLIISDLFYIHSNSLYSDGYVVFFNLEESKIYEKLEKIICYMKDSCSLEVTMFFIGVYNKEVLEENKENNIIKFLDDIGDMNYEYIEMKLTEDEKSIDDGKLNEKKIIENLFITISDVKSGIIKKPLIKNNDPDKSGNLGNSVGCRIF